MCVHRTLGVCYYRQTLLSRQQFKICALPHTLQAQEGKPGPGQLCQHLWGAVNPTGAGLVPGVMNLH